MVLLVKNLIRLETYDDFVTIEDFESINSLIFYPGQDFGSSMIMIGWFYGEGIMIGYFLKPG